MLRKLPLLVAASVISTTVAQAQSEPLYRTVFSSDSINVRYPTVSPDERWLVFTVLLANEETKLMIQPLAGGAPRDLFAVKGYHDYPRFVPAGDRLVFVSDLPSRGPADNKTYLVSAPFDTRTGELSGSPRQISLEPVSAWWWRNPAISPDGRSIAYVANQAIRVIPLNGGAARTLVEPHGFPTSLAWSPDGRFLSYQLSERPLGGFAAGSGPVYVRMRLSLDGGAPIVMARSSERLGPQSPDGQYSFAISFGGGNGPTNARWFDENDRFLGETKLPPHVHVVANLGVSSKYIPVASERGRSSVKVVPVSGGPIRKVSAGNDWDGAGGWSADGELVQVLTAEQGHVIMAQYTLRGELKSQVRLPDDIRMGLLIGIRDGRLIYRGELNTPESGRLMALSLNDGSRRELAKDVVGIASGPGGLTSFSSDREVYYRQTRGSRVQVYGVRAAGSSRLIGEIPTSALGASVFENRIVYGERSKDSVRLQVVAGRGLRSTTLATFDSNVEFVWSHDGRKLAATTGKQRLLVYPFDADGSPQGAPTVFVLPFEDWFGISWLPDGSGLTMIATPRGTTLQKVAVVRLADPQHPVVLTMDDPESLSSYILSPDGKYVAFTSADGKDGVPYQRHREGSSIYLIDVAELLKQVQAKK